MIMLVKIVVLWFMLNIAFFVALLPNLRAPARDTSIADARRRIAQGNGGIHREQ